MRGVVALLAFAACGAPPSSTDWIAFDSLRGGNRDIYRVRTDGSGLVRLTDDPGNDREPAWSPDGTEIVFSSDRSGFFQLYIMPSAGGAAALLPVLAEDAQQPTWSADGKTIAYHSGSSVRAIEADGLFNRDVIDATGFVYENPVFATNGKLLADARNAIVDVALDGKTRDVVRGSATDVLQPTVSLDGYEVACSIACEFPNMQSLHSLWISPRFGYVDACREGTRVTVVGDLDSRAPSFGPTGELAYERGDAPSRIAIVAIGETASFVTDGSGDDRNPAWAPPGTNL